MALSSPIHLNIARLLGVTLAVQVAACASVSGAKPAKPSSGEGKRVAKLSIALDAHRKRLTELEARLALLESETRGGRVVARSETVRIGGERSRDVMPEPEAVRPPPASARREEEPVRLQLYGRPRAQHGLEAEAEANYQAPVVAERLAVAPLPSSLTKGAGHRATGAGHRATGAGVRFKARYAAALQFLQEQNYPDAKAAFTALAEDFPEHRLADNVIYWRAEVAYAMRAYRASARLFESLVTRFPRSDKLPQALFKAGLCYRRLGRDEVADEFLARVKSEFPDSEVARLASAEGSR